MHETNQSLATTRRLAAFAAGVQYGDMPAATVGMAKRLLLDGIGCMLAGTQGGPGLSAAAMVRRLGGEPQAAIFTGNTRGSVRDAAFVNGVTLYSVGLNDIHKPAGAHPAGCVIPVLLALGEWRRLPGTALLAAMAAGYEATGRVGRAMIPSHRKRGFHPTGTCGTFGATAAAGRLLGLDAEQMANAFGIAGSQAAGLYECHHDGTLTMIFHAGRAAQNGIEAALLTQEGFTGPATVLEGSKGVFRAMSDAHDEAAAMSDLGTRFELDATSFRPYFGCNSTIAGSGAMAQIMRRAGAIKSDDVEQITVYCHPIVAQDNAESDPRTLLGARLSLPFNLALVVVHGDVLTADLEEKDLGDERIRNLLPRVVVVTDDKMQRYGSRVIVKLKSGRSEEATIDFPLGGPTTPLSWDNIVEKFCSLVRPLIRESDRRAVVDAIAEIESLDGVQLADVLRAAVA